MTRSENADAQTRTTAAAICRAGTQRKESSCPAKELSLPSSSAAEERTAKNEFSHWFSSRME